MYEIPSFLLICSVLTSSESFRHSTVKDLENIYKGNIIIGSSLKKSAQISALEAFFPPSSRSSGAATLPGTEEAVYCHMTQQTQHPHTIWPTTASPRSSLPSPLPGNKADREAEITLYKDVCDVIRGC